MNNCVDCPIDFVYDTDTSYCIPPDVNQIRTLQTAYKFTGFSQVDGWTGGNPYTDSLYGPTIYKSTGGAINREFALTPAHYQFRLLVSLWIADGAASSNDWIQIKFYQNGDTSAFITHPLIDNLDIAATTLASGYQIYPSGWRAINIDQIFTDNSHDIVRI